MKFVINRELLLASLQNVSRGLSDKKPMPVLTGIKITVEKDRIVFVTSNREISVQVILEANNDVVIEDTGVCVVPGKYFLEIVKKLEGKEVEFTLFESTTIKIISDRSDFTLVTYDASNFPALNFDSAETPIHLDAQMLKNVIKQTSFAAATSEARIVLTSINFKFYGNKLEITATDSYRLARKNIEFEDNFDSKIINIPSKSLEELSKIIEDTHEDIELIVENKTVLFKYRNVVFTTRLVEGVYPDTSIIVPKGQMLAIRFNKNELLAAIDRASLFTNSDNLSIVKLVLTTDKIVKVSSNSTEMGRVEDEIYPLEVSEAMDFQIAFSTRNLSEALKSFESQSILMKFTGEVKPAVIVGEKENDLIQLLLPVRVF